MFNYEQKPKYKIKQKKRGKQKMSEYQLEMMMDLSDEEFMDYMRNHKRKINKKEIETDGEESNYDIYC